MDYTLRPRRTINEIEISTVSYLDIYVIRIWHVNNHMICNVWVKYCVCGIWCIQNVRCVWSTWINVATQFESHIAIVSQSAIKKHIFSVKRIYSTIVRLIAIQMTIYYILQISWIGDVGVTAIDIDITCSSNIRTICMEIVCLIRECNITD